MVDNRFVSLCVGVRAVMYLLLEMIVCLYSSCLSVGLVVSRLLAFA